RIIDSLTRLYDIVLIDAEAGLEHISRRTDRDVDVFFIITDPSRMGFLTVSRIIDLTKKLHINFKKVYLVGNRFPKNAEKTLYKFAREIGIQCIASLPLDENISQFNLLGKSILELPENSAIIAPLKNIVENYIKPLL
ncbi:MAG: hypothetical protein QW261_12785, partial [Candidatus Jordarchaeaceae archaeon]